MTNFRPFLGAAEKRSTPSPPEGQSGSRQTFHHPHGRSIRRTVYSHHAPGFCARSVEVFNFVTPAKDVFVSKSEGKGRKEDVAEIFRGLPEIGCWVYEDHRNVRGCRCKCYLIENVICPISFHCSF